MSGQSGADVPEPVPIKSVQTLRYRVETLPQVEIWHFVASMQARGAETFALQLCKTLHAAGLKQQIIVLSAVDIALEVPDGVEITYLTQESRHAFRVVQRLRGKVADDRPEVVLCYGMQPLKFLRWATVGLRQSPLIMYQKIGFSLPWIKSMRWLRCHYLRFILRAVDKCIVMGPAQSVELEKVFGVPRININRIPNARVFPSILTYKIPNNNQILFLGALAEEKQPDIALEVLVKLRAEGIQANLKFVGTGPLADSVEEYARQILPADCVQLTGAVNDVWGHLCESSVLLLCSRTEGVPGVLIEAAYAGLPVVCWDVGDVKAVVADGETGLVTPFADVDGLVAACKTLLLDSVLCEQMGVRAKLKSKEFEMNRVAQLYLDSFSSLLKGEK
ncbi:MAG: glycosyltransferase family 4 protein [Pseudomonadales bacterium]|nr:glycosyltransferase family 4 protein [Pseudomonadales bacterium]